MPLRRSVLNRPNVRTPVRRRTIWAETSGTVAPIVGTPSQVDLLSNLMVAAGLSSLLGITVTRIRGFIQLGVAATVSAHGIRVGEETTDAIDQAPADFPYLDWMWKSVFSAPTAEHLGGPVANQVIDIRGQRRMDEAQQRLWLASQAVAGAPACRFFFRILLKLP